MKSPKVGRVLNQKSRWYVPVRIQGEYSKGNIKTINIVEYKQISNSINTCTRINIYTLVTSCIYVYINIILYIIYIYIYIVYGYCECGTNTGSMACG